METHVPSGTARFFDVIAANDLVAVKALLDFDPGLAHARLVTYGDDGKPQGGSGCITALGAAAQAGHLELVKLLIQRGAQIYDDAQWGYPAVELAHWAHQSHVVDYFLGEVNRHPTLLSSPTYGLGIEIHLAARNGWLEKVKEHLALDPLAVFSRGLLGDTPLHWAGHNGHLEVVRALVEAGAPLEADEIGLYGGKPLHWAGEHEPHVVQYLLDQGAAVDSRNLKSGETPLITCARQRNDCAASAELLLKAGADPTATDNLGKTALDWATERNSAAVGQLLRDLAL